MNTETKEPEKLTRDQVLQGLKAVMKDKQASDEEKRTARKLYYSLVN